MTDFRTATGQIVGTPAYMAPEQITGGEITPQVDLYATGLIAYELLAGRHPFDGTDAPMALLMHHVSDEPPPLGERPAGPPARASSRGSTRCSPRSPRPPRRRGARRGTGWRASCPTRSGRGGGGTRRSGAGRRPGRSTRGAPRERAVRDLLDRAAAPADADRRVGDPQPPCPRRGAPVRRRAGAPEPGGAVPSASAEPGAPRRAAGAGRPLAEPPARARRPRGACSRLAGALLARDRGDHVLDGARQGAPRGAAPAGRRRRSSSGCARRSRRRWRPTRSCRRSCRRSPPGPTPPTRASGRLAALSPRPRRRAPRCGELRDRRRRRAPPACPRGTRAPHAVASTSSRPRRAAAAGRTTGSSTPSARLGAARVAAGAHRDGGPAGVRDRRRRTPPQAMGPRRAGRPRRLARNVPDHCRAASGARGRTNRRRRRPPRRQ